jgi:hypothetical protein
MGKTNSVEEHLPSICKDLFLILSTTPKRKKKKSSMCKRYKQIKSIQKKEY